jgi:hypothetical protein
MSAPGDHFRDAHVGAEIMRRSLLLVVATFFMIVFGSAPASAKPAPDGGCGTGFELTSVRTVLRTIAAPGSEDAIRAEDGNQDGYLCVKIIPNDGGPPQFDPAFAFVDNNSA